MDRLKFHIIKGIRAAKLGIIWSAALVAIKILAGILGHSYALIADGVESATDVVMSAVVWRGLRASGKEANDDYHFGYGKAEPLSAAVVAALMVVAGISVGTVALHTFNDPTEAPSVFTLPILIFVIIVKEIIARKVGYVGKEIDSVAVKNDAAHHRTDVITSAIAFIGISCSLFGGPEWRVADKIAALLCCVVIVKNGITMFRESAHQLMDKAPDDAVIETITKAAYSVPEVKMVEKVLARKSGLAYFIAMHVHADPNMTLHDSHIVGGKVKTAVKKAIPVVKDVLVHMEPAED